MSKTKQSKRLKAKPVKIVADIDFDHPDFMLVAKALADTRGLTMSQFYGQLIQSCLGSYKGNEEGRFIDEKLEQLYDLIGLP